MAIVKNVKGHYKTPLGYASWLNYWERNSHEIAEVCSEVHCEEADDLVGSHLRKVPDDGNIYLAPLCMTHNNYRNEDEFEVPDGLLLQVPKEDLKEDVLEDYKAAIREEMK